MLTLDEVQARFVNKRSIVLDDSSGGQTEFGSSGNGGVVVGSLLLLMTYLNTPVETKGFNYGLFSSNRSWKVNSRQLTDNML
jgi:hypothetical protein